MFKAGWACSDLRSGRRIDESGNWPTKANFGLRAIARLAARDRAIADELSVTFVGTPVAAHQRLAARLGLEPVVHFTGRLPFADAARAAARADVLLVIDAPAADNLFLPSKLVEYLPMRKPILGLTPPRGASADVIDALGYTTVAPDDEAAIAAAIESLIAAKRERRLEVSPHHAAVARQYDIRQTTATFSEILVRCCDRKSRESCSRIT